MSSAAGQNVELVSTLMETMNSGPGSKYVVPRFDEFIHPEVEWRGSAAGRDAPGSEGVYRGHEGMARFWAEMEDVWDEMKIETERIEPIGDDLVLGLFAVTATGHSSGVRLEQELGVVYEFRDGRIVAGENFISHADAEAQARALAEERSNAQA